MRNVLSHVPASAMGEVAEDLKAIFKVRREKSAWTLAEEFVALYHKRFAKAISVFEVGVGHALTPTCATREASTRGYARRICWRGYSRR
jgi:transposase-like protein